MKKLLLLSLFFLLVVGGARSQTCTTTISTFPYLENFESGAGGWAAGGTASSWALGTPAKPVINSAASGTKAWVTGLTGSYSASENSAVVSPCFNFTSVIEPIIEMKVWWSSEASWDGAVLQSSIDGGTTWQKVGAFGEPNNWYNDNSLDGLPGGQNIGWGGQTSTGSNGWVLAKHVLNGLGGQANVKLRIAFGADPDYHYDGFAFDDIRIYDTPANDAGITSITSPAFSTLPVVSTPVNVTVKNYGTSPLTAATLGYSVNGVAQPTFAWTGNLALNTVSAPVTIGNFSFPVGTHTIKAWSSQPNGATDAINGNDTTSITIHSCNTLTGTYTINKGIATSATNFPSFTAAAQALKNCGISGPVTFNVVGGSGPYTEALTLTNIAGTSVANTITFQGNGNTLVSPSATSEAVIKLNGAKFFRFNNLTFQAELNATGGSVVLLTSDADNNIFSNNIINHSISTTGTAFAVYLNLGSDNNSFQNNTINGGYYGIYNAGANVSSRLDNNQFTGNTLKDQYYYAILSLNASNSLFEGNDISRPVRTNGSTFYGIYLNSGNISATISKNRIHNSHDVATLTTGTVYGIYTNSTGTLGSENIIKNNVIYNINNTGGYFYGLYNNGGNHTYYFHNTVSADMPGVSYAFLRGIYFSSGSTNVKVMNNNISLTSPAPVALKHALYLGSATISLVSNGNNLYAPGGNVGYFSADKATLADWKAVNTNAYDQNSVSDDPQFVNLATGNLKANNSSLNNIGSPVTPAVTDDITGITRNATTPDPGAYEFTPSANDAGVVSIISPVSPVTPGVPQPVNIILKNSGLNPLTTVTVTWTVNGVAQPNYTWTGNLLNNQTSAPVTIGTYTFAAGTVALNVCTSNPNAATDGNPGNDCKLVNLIVCNALAGTYTIDKNSPASATNFVSFVSAVGTLNSCGISGPVTFNVASGTGPYTEQVDIRITSGASATNTITFNGNGNTLISGSAIADVVLKLNGAKWMRFNNLRIEVNAGSTLGSVVSLENAADNNIFSNCILAHSITSVATSQGLNILTGSSNNTFQNNTIIGGYSGIYNYGATALTNNNNQFIGNILKEQYFYGVNCYSTTGTLFQGNDISRPTRTNGGSLYAFYMTTGNTSFTISKNRIHNTHDAATALNGLVYGIYIGAPGTAGNENIVKNNAIYNLNNTSGTIYALYNSGGSNTYYYHNTVSVDYPAANYSAVRGMYFSAASTNVKFMNNSISLAGPATSKHAVYLGSATIALQSDRNNLYSPNGKIGYFSGDKVTLADWKLANTGTYDQNSVSADPLFVAMNTGDLRPTTVTLNNIGTPVTPAVPDDLTGATRSLTTPDIGAFEFSVNPNDVGIIKVSGPSLTGCGLSATETIKVKIKNFGSSTQTAFQVSYKVNGNPVTEPWTGSLAPNDTITYVFTTKANLSTSMGYVIVGEALLTGDLVANNNFDTLRVINSLIPGLPMTFDFETAATGLSRFRKEIRSKSNIIEDVAASSPLGTTSTKGIIMDGVDQPNWLSPVGVTDPWTNNPDNFSAAYICISPASGAASDSLWLTFDLKQLFKTANANTNFRVTINGQQIGTTYRPPFTGTPIVWKHYKVDLTQFKNDPTVMIGLESSVKEAYANGAGPANLLDNVMVLRRLVVSAPTGVKENTLASQLNVFPNPSNGQFNVSLPAGKAYSLEVTDLTGKVICTQKANGNTQLKLENPAKGIYLLKVTSEGATTVKKLIVE
jgi:hypothetical protein